MNVVGGKSLAFLPTANCPHHVRVFHGTPSMAVSFPVVFMNNDVVGQHASNSFNEGFSLLDFTSVPFHTERLMALRSLPERLPHSPSSICSVRA